MLLLDTITIGKIDRWKLWKKGKNDGKNRLKMKMRKFTIVGFSCCFVNSQNNFLVAFLYVWYKQNDKTIE